MICASSASQIAQRCTIRATSLRNMSRQKTRAAHSANRLWWMMGELVSRAAAVGLGMTILEKVKKVTRRATMTLRILQIRGSVESR